MSGLAFSNPVITVSQLPLVPSSSWGPAGRSWSTLRRLRRCRRTSRRIRTRRARVWRWPQERPGARIAVTSSWCVAFLTVWCCRSGARRCHSMRSWLVVRGGYGAGVLDIESWTGVWNRSDYLSGSYTNQEIPLRASCKRHTMIEPSFKQSQRAAKIDPKGPTMTEPSARSAHARRAHLAARDLGRGRRAARCAAPCFRHPAQRVAVVGCGTSWFMAQSYAALREIEPARARPTHSRRPRPSSIATTTPSSRSRAPARRPRCSNSVDAHQRTRSRPSA